MNRPGWMGMLAPFLVVAAAWPAPAPAADSPAPSPLQSLTEALSGNWSVQVHFDAIGAHAQPIDGQGEESWRAGPGGINLIEQEHFPSPFGDTFLMGIVWWDSTKSQLAGVECNSYLPVTCDLKGGLNDITLTWDGKKFQIDELETHDGKRTVWHEYWTNITPSSFDQTGDVTQPDGSTVRFMTVHGKRVEKLETLGKS
jgi:hypothetical protein